MPDNKILQRERFLKQEKKNDFGGAFWLLKKETTGKEFMSHVGYQKILPTQKTKKMKSHLRVWSVTLLVNGKKWDGKTMWTEADVLLCPELKDFR